MMGRLPAMASFVLRAPYAARGEPVGSSLALESTLRTLNHVTEPEEARTLVRLFITSESLCRLSYPLAAATRLRFFPPAWTCRWSEAASPRLPAAASSSPSVRFASVRFFSRVAVLSEPPGARSEPVVQIRTKLDTRTLLTARETQLGARGGNRTLDLFITSESLCRLSYPGNPAKDSGTHRHPGGEIGASSALPRRHEVPYHAEAFNVGRGDNPWWLLRYLNHLLISKQIRRLPSWLARRSASPNSTPT